MAYSDSAGAKEATRQITGAGLLRPTATPSVTSYDFGAVKVANSSDVTITITTDLTGADLSNSKISDGGSLISPFSYKGGVFPGTGGTCGSTTANCTVVVSVNPLYEAQFYSILTLNFSHGSAIQIELRANTSDWSSSSLNVASTDFGTKISGSVKETTVLVVNAGGVPASELQEASPSLANISTDFRFKGGAYPGTGGTCPAVLGVAEQCTMVLEMYGAVAGARSAVLRIAYKNGKEYQISTATLTGTVVAQAGLKFATPARIPFGSSGAAPNNAGFQHQWEVFLGVTCQGQGWSYGPISATIENNSSGTATDIKLHMYGKVIWLWDSLNQSSLREGEGRSGPTEHEICGGSLAAGQTCTFSAFKTAIYQGDYASRSYRNPALADYFADSFRLSDLIYVTFRDGNGKKDWISLIYTSACPAGPPGPTLDPDPTSSPSDTPEVTPTPTATTSGLPTATVAPTATATTSGRLIGA